ncbi:uncharacterized protein si:ch211-110p13.9 [Pimephales promelas]|uniref:uncharacterized protein si:ch211-110p13.9 n=1 Tax=Pimephales promelas TaxID=90988 RepID=UPI001955DB81|nr:uncharacterized protein si:ch211-110p13.9 [Pimephales promelas]KAG1957559.1 hypothetical protein F2P79_007555 [Pimephales promelas]
MTSGGVSLINMSYWESGKRRIRLLYLTNNNTFNVTKQCTNEDQMIPLFLGADLFSDTDVRSENQPRYHAKYAKRGLATKLVFSSDFRFQGLRLPFSNNSLWFYSVQGVFRVAFDLYSKQDQLSIMESFQDLWKSRINDNNLNTTYHLGAQDVQPQNDQETQTILANNKTCTSYQGHQHSDGGEMDIFPITTVESDISSSTDHDYCSSTEQTNLSQCRLLADKLHSLAEKLKLLTNMEAEQVNTTTKLLDYVEYSITGMIEEERLTETVMALLHSHFKSYSIYSSSLLKAVAGWLGQQFNAANGTISHRVEGFKTQHIEHITNLPPPEELATELFPEAMRNLLAHWMGLSDEAEHWKRHSEYPILLLILEFANHNLITGVAHVLYSSLICK